MATFPTFAGMNAAIVRSSEYDVTEHKTISGMKQKTLWSNTPIVGWNVTINVLRTDATLTGTWGTLSEVDTLQWFWDNAHGSYGTHTWTDPQTGTSYTVGFVKDSFAITKEEGYYSAAFDLEVRK